MNKEQEEKMGVDEERAREHPRKERNAREKERDSMCRRKERKN